MRRLRNLPLLGVFLLGVLGISDAALIAYQTETVAEFPRPTGIYALGPGLLQPLERRLANVRDYPFVDGYALRVGWGELEVGPGQYDFSLIEEAIARLEPLGQKLTLALMASAAPQYLLNDPNVETYVAVGSRAGGSQDERRVVPWDETVLARYEAFAEALAHHPVPDATAGGRSVPLKDHPVLAQIAASIPGLGSVRDKERRLVSSPGYEREKFIRAVLRALHAIADRFPDKFSYVGFFRMRDSIRQPALDEALLERLVEEFDGVRHPRLGLFQENLACSTPTPEFAFALAREKDNRPILFQMLQSWVNPFANPEKTEPCRSESHGPDIAMRYAFETFNSRYFEVYVADLDYPGFRGALQEMHDFLDCLR